jgi:hypothetical protein
MLKATLGAEKGEQYWIDSVRLLLNGFIISCQRLTLLVAILYESQRIPRHAHRTWQSIRRR